MSYRDGYNQNQQANSQPTSPAILERQRQWAQGIDRAWSEMQVENDWSKRWEIMCGSGTTYEMCVELDRMAERRWGEDWVNVRAIERKVALEALREVNAIMRGRVAV
jgi:hypothetical protein